MKTQTGTSKTLIAAIIGVALAVLLVALTVTGVSQFGPILYACFVVPLVAGTFYFTRRSQKSRGINPAVVFFVMTFSYVFALVGGITLGVFSLR